ncbi:hypothetical protein EV363DRAFT_1299600 [Boletus edulis]|nr:hypothetical protein EV363DRAFT_1299600 [Boletus edulis]
MLVHRMILTKEDLDRAKSLVLDLLGWDVTLEYLVERGLSQSAAIYAIFTDLRLRLPSNTDTLAPLLSHHAHLCLAACKYMLFYLCDVFTTALIISLRTLVGGTPSKKKKMFSFNLDYP